MSEAIPKLLEAMKCKFQALKDTNKNLEIEVALYAADLDKARETAIKLKTENGFMLNRLGLVHRDLRLLKYAKKRKSQGIKNVACLNAREYCLDFKSFNEFSNAHRFVVTQCVLISKIFGRRACAYFSTANRLTASNLSRFGYACVTLSKSVELCNYLDGFEKGLNGNVFEVIAKILEFTFFTK
jgi:hypothetical protein